MALTNEILVGRFSGLLTKLLSMKEGSPAPVLMPEIQAALVLENDRPEWAFLQGQRLAVGGFIEGAVVGQLNTMQLVNPAASGVLIVVEEFGLATDAAVGMQAGVSDATVIGTLRNSFPRDTRLGLTQGLTTGRLRARVGVGAQIATPFMNGRIPLDGTFRWTTPIVLAPNSSLLVEETTTNVTTRGWFVWRERALEPSETR